MGMGRTYFLCLVVNGEERRYKLDSSVTACLEIFAPPFAEIIGKIRRHLLPGPLIWHENHIKPALRLMEIERAARA
jgi:hypothetical protein